MNQPNSHARVIDLPVIAAATSASAQSSLESITSRTMGAISLIVSVFTTRRHIMAALAVILMALAGSQRATAAGELELYYTDRMNLAWWDVGSDGDHDGSFWVPDVPPGYKALGHVAVGGYGKPAGMTVVKVAGAGSALAYPTDFVAFWYDGGSGADLSTQFWRPVPPTGYVSLGTVCGINTYDKPALDSVVCVRSDLAVAASIGGSYWDDSGSGGDQDGSSWDIVAPAGAIDINAFQGQRSHSAPSETVYCLKASAVASPSAPTDAALAQAIYDFGPVFKFHPDEPWMPDDPAVMLNDPATRLKWMTVQNESDNPGFAQTDLGSSTTSASTILNDIQQVLSHPMANDPSFKYLLDYPSSLIGGNLSRTKAWVRVQPHNETTELQFWIFYPYNGPGKARMTVGDIYEEYYDPTGTMGIHYSDWECVRVRLTNKNVWAPGTYKLSSVVLSRHSSDEEIFAGDPRLTLVSGSPVVYVGKGSHAHYPTPGRHFYDRPKSEDFGIGTFAIDLYDLTGEGQSFNAYSSSKYVIVSSAWPGITTAPPDWLFFGGIWGKYLMNEFSVTFNYGFGSHTETQREVGNGKPGLLRRAEWDVAFPQNANLGLLRTNAGTISPAFNPNVTAYTLNAGAGVSQLTLLAQASEDNALVEVRANGGAWVAMGAGQLLGRQSNPLNLSPGSNTVEVRVTNPPPSAPVPGLTAAVRTYTLTATGPTLDQALDTTGLTWTSSGSASWFEQTAVTHDGVDAARSGAIGDSQESRVETNVTGPGTLTFWWKASTEFNYDILRFYMDGASVGTVPEISGEVDWQQISVSVPAGSHVLRWIFSKDVSQTAGQDCAWLDQVTFCTDVSILTTALPDGAAGAAYSYTMTAGVQGFAIQQSFSSAQVNSLAAADAVLNGTNRTVNWTGFVPELNFLGGGGGGNFLNSAAFPGGDGDNFALKATGFIDIPGAGPWTIGTSSDDGVRVKVDGNNVINDDNLHSAEDRFGTATLTAGLHSIELVFLENGGDAELELFAAPGTYTTFNSAFKLIGSTGGLPVVRPGPAVTWSLASGALPPGLTLNAGTGLISGTPTGAGGVYDFVVQATDAAGGCAGTRPLSITVRGLPQALDTTGLTWTPGGTGNWYAQTAITHDGVDAAQSGDINDNEANHVETTVTGPATLTFWWKVSSESGFDFLLFTLDGAAVAGISGDVDWQQKTVPIPAGNHTVRWTYSKDGSESEGADAAWLDQVSTGGYTAWAAGNIPAGQDAAFPGDWNRDGIINGVAYVFGNTRLNSPGRGRVPAPPAIPADVDVQLERSTTLTTAGSWSPIASWINGAAPTFAGGVSLVSGEIRDTISGPKAFYRYRVVLR